MTWASVDFITLKKLLTIENLFLYLYVQWQYMQYASIKIGPSNNKIKSQFARVSAQKKTVSHFNAALI